MKTKIRQLSKHHLQNILEIKSPKNLGYVLLQYCQSIIDLFSIDRCGILIPNSSVFIESIFARASKEDGTIDNNIFIPTPCMPWKWKTAEQNTPPNKGIIILPGILPSHPYRQPIENLFKCLVRSLVIIPLSLNNEIIGYLILLNERKTCTFCSNELSLLYEIAAHAINSIKMAIKMIEEEQRDKIIEVIKKYKQNVSMGREKDPEIIVNFLRIAHLHILRVILINKDPQKGTKWYHAEVNDTLQVEKVETGTLSDNTFDFFIHEINILDPDYLDIPIKIESNVVGKLAIKYLQTEYNRALRENYFKLLLAIAPYLADLMYL